MGRDGVNGYTDKEGDTKPDQTAPVTIQHIDGEHTSIIPCGDQIQGPH